MSARNLAPAGLVYQESPRIARILERRTLVMCDQLTTVDLTRLAERAGFLTLEEMQRVDEALYVALDL